MLKYALVMAIEFFDALFKVHHTKGFRLTYPIPLPTSVAGIFSGILGVNRSEVGEKFESYEFGAALSRGQVKVSVEQSTFIQFGKNRLGVAKTHLLVEPAYYMVAASNSKDELEEMERKMYEGIEYLPFGGQNDFFPKDWRVVGIREVSVSKEVGNYLPSDWVAALAKDVTVEILPVSHKLGGTQQFHFVLNGHLESKHEISVCRIDETSIALYPLKDFYLVGDY